MLIHHTAIIDKNAKIANNVKIGAYSIIHGNVEIGQDTTIDSHVVIHEYSKIGKSNYIGSFSSIGGKPQDKKYKNEVTYLEIGDRNEIRENVTINRGTTFGGNKTVIGNDNLIMSMVHIGHDCIIGNHNVLANGSALSGHVTLESNVIIGGMSGVHQFCKIGKGAMVGGMSPIRGNILPFSLIKHEEVMGVNIVGLRRMGYRNAQIKEISDCVKYLTSQNNVNFLEKIKIIKQKNNSDSVNEILQFIEKADISIGFINFKNT